MKTIELYPHNQETYDKIQTLWETENKVAAVQATGTGKSYLILKCIYNDPKANKVVLAPSNYILEQLINEAGEELPNTKTLTYSKLSYMSDTEIKELNIGYIFLDEFHRCGAEQWGDGVQRLLNIFPDAKVLGTSATHIRFLDNARNMGEELFNGNIVNNLSLAEAIVKKILPMPKYISALYTYDNEIDNLKTKVENSKNDEESKKEMLKEIELMKHKLEKSKGIPNILKKHLSKNYNGKFIIFCKDKVHLDEMKETVVEWFKQSKVTKEVNVYSVYSNYEYGNAEVEAFIENKNPKSVKLLFSIEMFNEGIHIEDVTGVILLRPTVSPIIYYQQIGRAMQVGKNNTPVIFDLVNNFDNIGAKNFVEDLEKEVRKENDKSDKDDDKGDDEEKGYVDISEFMIFDETLEAMDLFANIEGRLIDNWDAMYKQLETFYKENGHSNISEDFDKKLYIWSNNQMCKFKKNLMDIEKIQKLNEINFIFDRFANLWNNMYLQLCSYVEENGNCNVSSRNGSLGQWVHSQKQRYKKGEITHEEFEKLDKLGFIWGIGMYEKGWEEMFNGLVDFKSKFGNFNIPGNYKVNGVGLLSWVNNQKDRKKRNKLTESKILMLEELGVVWESLDFNWTTHYEKLKTYYEINNKYPSPHGEDKILYSWVSNQRLAFKKGAMNLDKINLLKKIAFDFKIDKKEQPKWIDLYEKYRQIGPIPPSHEDKKLYNWQQNIRRSYKSGTLSTEKIDLLDKIGFIWEPKIEQNKLLS